MAVHNDDLVIAQLCKITLWKCRRVISTMENNKRRRRKMVARILQQLEDEEADYLRRRAIMIAHLRRRLNQDQEMLLCSQPRSVWVKDRSQMWINHVVANWTDEQFKENFRLNRNSFSMLVEELRPFLMKKNTDFRVAVSVETRVAVGLWRLGSYNQYRVIGHLFGLGKSTCVAITNEFIDVIVNQLMSKYIVWPKGERLRKVIAGFKRSHAFPQVGGAIDGTHIKILAPSQNPSDYFSRHHCHTIVLQAVCDDRYCFTNIDVGWPGKTHDARIFRNSTIYKKGSDGSLFDPVSKGINGVPVPALLIGDPAYPLLPWLMKPFPGSGLGTQRECFNYKLSATRMKIENTFGRLKARMRCLLTRLDCNIERIPKVVAACCVLHNICEMNNDFVAVEDMTPISHGANEQSEESTIALAQDVRNAIAIYLKE